MRVRLRGLKEAATESAVRGDVRKLIDDLSACAKDGKFEGKQALLNFFLDAARGLKLASFGDDGELKMSCGVRWHESTHRIFEVLKHYGGPRSHRWIQKNLFGMHLRTTEKRWAADLHHYEFGLNEGTFVELASFYRKVCCSTEIPSVRRNLPLYECTRLLEVRCRGSCMRSLVLGSCGCHYGIM